MAESSLTLDFTQLRIEVADFLGLGRDSSNWTNGSDDRNRIHQIINTAVRRFLLPLTAEGGIHEWSFLNVTASLSAVADDYDYTLGDSVGAVEGDLVYSSQVGYPDIRRVTEADIHRARSVSTATGIPTMYATRWIANDGSSGQRLELLLYPTPNGAYTLTYHYKVLPNALDATSAIYLLGGMMHSDTLLCGCKAVAEETMDDTQGMWSARYAERLAASIALDREQQRGEWLGYNRDGNNGLYTDGPYDDGRRFSFGTTQITYT